MDSRSPIFMWSPDSDTSEYQELSVYSLARTSSFPGTTGHDYTPDSPDFPKRTSRIPLLHNDFSHQQTFRVPSTGPGRSTIGRDAQNQYPSHDHRSQTRRALTIFASQFEAPDWQQLVIHSGLCILAYLLLLLVVFVASSRPLFWTRTIVAFGSGLIGFTLGLIPLAFGRKFLEATAWATVIHRSCIPDASGVKLEDLAASSSDPYGAVPALRLLWDRWKYPGTARKDRQHYDRRPWSLAILYFLLIIFATAASSFAIGRLVNIDIYAQHQYGEFSEVAVKGDLSDADIAGAAALQSTFTDYTLTWTLTPSSDHGGLPPAVSFQWNNDTVYFAEVILPQLQSNGKGFGTFEMNSNMTTMPVTFGGSQHGDALNAHDIPQTIDPGAILRFPRWGTRLHCAKIPDGERNLVTRSPNDFTYLFTPHNVLRPLFASFNMEYKGVPPFNASKVLKLNDTLPPGLNVADTAIGGAYYDTGNAHSFMSTPLTLGQEGRGFVTIEHVLVRLNTSYAPAGKFLRTSNISVPDINGKPSFIGYDAAVCLQLFEPWIVEVYNSTTSLPSSTRLVEYGNAAQQLGPGETRKGPPLTKPNVTRQLNSSKLSNVYIATHQNTINKIIEDNSQNAFYVPSPTLISFTSGSGALGYTELSETLFGQARGIADASNSLPYFVGSGDVLAHRYPDSVMSVASFRPAFVGLYLLGMWTLGLLGGLFVPKLPLNVPRRGFELYSWMAAFHMDELVGTEGDIGIQRNMELHEIADRLGGLRFRYQC